MKTHKYCLNTFIMVWLAFGMTADASITTNYGNFEASTVWYNQVYENSDNGWYGSPVVAGSTLNFSPIGMKAESSGGGLEMVNHAQLGFDVQAKAGQYIEAFNFSEGGDFSMGGTGTDATYVYAAANYVVRILEVDGVAIDPITAHYSMPVSPNTDGTFELITDGGTSSVFTPYQGVWNGSVYIDLYDMLTNNAVSYINGATLAHVYIENILAAGSEAGTSSQISRKLQNGFSLTSKIIPEPSSFVLLMGTGSFLAYIRRKIHGIS